MEFIRKLGIAGGLLLCALAGCSSGDDRGLAVGGKSPGHARASVAATPPAASRPSPRKTYTDANVLPAAATGEPAQSPQTLRVIPRGEVSESDSADQSIPQLCQQLARMTRVAAVRSAEDSPPSSQPLASNNGEKKDAKPEVKTSTAEPYRGLPVPADLPGARQGSIRLPPPDGDATARRRGILAIYPPLPDLPAELIAQLSPLGHPLTLCELQEMALCNSPLLRQAQADIVAARGAAIQSGRYPNPTMGYQADTIGTGDTGGYQGGYVQQTIKTGGKLQLARAAAEQDVANAELAYRKARSDLLTQVRGGYFAVLVARENIRISGTLARFVDRGYQIQVDRLLAGESASYEPALLRVQALQVRVMLLQARNRYASAWKQLAATMGVPGMPPTELAGGVDMPVPRLDHNAALLRLLSSHTDVATASHVLQKAQTNLRQAEVVPIPDVMAQVAVQKDFTVPPFGTVTSMQIGMPIPFFDRNRGGIQQAEGQLQRASEEPHRVRDDLTSKLADAFERYQNNRAIVEYYNNLILADQVRIYRGIVARSVVDPDTVTYTDVVSAIQNLGQSAGGYVQALAGQWQAVVDVAGLMQVDDLFSIGELQSVACVPDLEHLCPLPCGHSCCVPLPPLEYMQGDGNWPAALPAAPARPTLPPAEEVTPGKDSRRPLPPRR